VLRKDIMHRRLYVPAGQTGACGARNERPLPMSGDVNAGFCVLQVKWDLIYCGAEGCDADLCCDDAPADSCAMYAIECPTTQVIDASVTCADPNDCTSDTCCKPRTCGTEQFECPAGYDVLDPETQCGEDCSTPVCCAPANCETWNSCAPLLALKEDAASLPCPAEGCSVKLCCQAQPTTTPVLCTAAVSCPAELVAREEATCLPGVTCSPAVCCAPRTCASFTCAAGTLVRVMSMHGFLSCL
jgi:hypothetical protein